MPTWSSEEELNHFLDDIKEEALDARGDINKNIEDNLNQFRGKQWTSKTSPVYLNNIIESAVEDKVGKLSETRPEISVLASVNGMKNIAEVIGQCVAAIWDTNQISYKAERLGIWCALSGVGFAGTPWNKYRAGGLGDIDFVIKDPRNCGVDVCVTDPADTDLGEYTYVEDYIPLDIIRLEYPGRGMLVKPDIRLSGVDASKTATDARGLVRGAARRLFGNKDKEKASAIPRGIVEEFFIKDRRGDIEDAGTVPIVKDLTKWAEDKGIPFPGGRRIIRAGTTILEDCYNPFWDGGSDLDMMGWKIDPETAWSADEVKSVRRMQETHNRIGDAVAKNALINATTRIIMDSGAISPKEKNKLNNQVGQIIEKAPGRTFEYNVPPPLPPDIIGFAWQLAARIREKIGVAEPPTTKDVPSIITGPAIEGLQLMLQTSIRTAARRSEAFYQRIGQKMISRVFQFYESSRILHYVGNQGKWMEFEFKRLNILKDAKGNIRSKEDTMKAYRDFRFVIQPGSSLAQTKTQRAQSKFLLVQLGLLHPREILSEFYANPDEQMEEAQKAKEQGLFSGMEQGKKPQAPGNSGAIAA